MFEKTLEEFHYLHYYFHEIDYYRSFDNTVIIENRGIALVNNSKKTLFFLSVKHVVRKYIKMAVLATCKILSKCWDTRQNDKNAL